MPTIFSHMYFITKNEQKKVIFLLYKIYTEYKTNSLDVCLIIYQLTKTEYILYLKLYQPNKYVT